MTVSALQHSDKLTLGVVAIWGIGEVGFALTDPRVRDLVKRNFPSVASQPSPPVVANQRPVYGGMNPEC
jgi:hypothetical protein